MKKGRKGKIAVLIALLLAGLAVGGWWYGKVARQRAIEASWILPEFTEPGNGARAPHSRAMGVEVGISTLEDVQEHLEALGLRCKDTSMRAMIQDARAQKMEEAAEQAEARGEVPEEGVDAISSASMQKMSKREANPQVRLSCTGVVGSRLEDRERTSTAVGRWLFVFDSPRHPLRHVSFRRMAKEPAAALEDAHAALAAMEATWGPPTETVDAPLPERGSSEERAGFAPLKPYRHTWLWEDLKVELSALDFGKRGVDVNELFEVPWPVRADAPARP